jgi:hypothetical protein
VVAALFAIPTRGTTYATILRDSSSRFALVCSDVRPRRAAAGHTLLADVGFSASIADIKTGKIVSKSLAGAWA